ncbi:hypothetical protein V6N13_106909 [Hibiscus sabdariffa]
MDILNIIGIVDIYVDHTKNYKTLAKGNEVGEGNNEVGECSNEAGEGSNKARTVESSNVKFLGDDTLEEAYSDSKEVECEEFVVGEEEVSADSKEVDCEEAMVGEEEVSADSKEVECEEVKCKEIVVGEEETTADSEDFLVNTEVGSDLDEVEDIRGKLGAGDDTLERDDVREIEGHESDYISPDDPGEYGETDEEGDDDICGAYRGKGKKSVKIKYDPQGLVPVINEYFPLLKHRIWARHIYATWHKKWKGLKRKVQFWNFVRSTFVEDFDDQLNILEGMGPTSTSDLLGIPSQHWSRAYFTGESKCDAVDNNLAEAFNGWIVDARCHPIISMLEEIRKMVMQRIHVKRTSSSKWKTKIAPSPLQKFERNMNVFNHCRLVWNGDGGFEFKVMSKRHKKKIRKDKDELVKPKYGKASRAGYKVRCSNCKQVGHRKNKCI